MNKFKFQKTFHEFFEIYAVLRSLSWGLAPNISYDIPIRTAKSASAQILTFCIFYATHMIFFCSVLLYKESFLRPKIDVDVVNNAFMMTYNNTHLYEHEV
jgi:hypothetical protein